MKNAALLLALGFILAFSGLAYASDYRFTEEFRDLGGFYLNVQVNLGEAVKGDPEAIKRDLTSLLYDRFSEEYPELDIIPDDTGDDNFFWLYVDLWAWDEKGENYYGSVRAEFLRTVNLVNSDSGGEFQAAVWTTNWAIVGVTEDESPASTATRAATSIADDFIAVFDAAREE